MRKNLLFAIAFAFYVLIAASASATVIDWTNWQNANHGTTAPVNITYAGPGWLVSNYPSYHPASTWADGTIVQDAPTIDQIIGLAGGNTTLNTITFSDPVKDPVMAIWSLGDAQASFVFSASEPFTIVAGGPSAEYGGSSITASGNTVYGEEGNGTILFNGTFSSLTWTNPQYEYWYGFDIGVPASVPEPSTFLLSGIGLLTAAFFLGKAIA